MASRFVGVLRSPRATLADVALESRWLWMLLTLTLLAAGSSFLFLSTESGESAGLDMVVRQLENVGVAVDDARYAWLLDRIPSYRWLALAGTLVGAPALALGLTALLFAMFRVTGNRSVGFQALAAVVVHSGVVLSFKQLIALPLNYITESWWVPTNLGAMLPMIEESSFIAALLGGIDLFTIWWLVVLSLGLSQLYPAPARRIAARLLACYAVVALVTAIAITSLRIT